MWEQLGYVLLGIVIAVSIQLGLSALSGGKSFAHLQCEEARDDYIRQLQTCELKLADATGHGAIRVEKGMR